MNRRNVFGICLVVLLALILASCGGAATPAQPSTGGNTPAGGGDTSGGGAAGTGNQVVITPDSAGKTTEMKVGDQLLVKLGTEGNCTVDVTPTFLLNTVDGAKLNPGEQGLYKATMKGQATVQATCSNSKQYNMSIVIAP